MNSTLLILLIAGVLGGVAYLVCWMDYLLWVKQTYFELELFGRSFVLGDRSWYDEERRAAMRRHPAGSARR